MATGIELSIKYSRNKLLNFLPQIDINSFFINQSNKTEIKNILSLDPLNSISPNSIATKILKLLGNDISTQFPELFNVSFSECVFPSLLKTRKVIATFTKRFTVPDIGLYRYCQTLITLLTYKV